MNDILITKYLGNECTEEEKNDLENWILASRQNKDEFEKIKKIWDASSSFSPDVIAAYKIVEKRINEDRPLKLSRFKRTYYLIAAILILGIITTSLYFLTNTDSSNWKNISSSNQKEHFILPDNSEVWLNKNSSLSYSISETGKRLCQLKGEAYFEITKNKERPFIIETNHTSILVIGTSFNIESNPISGDKLSVVSGTVKISEINNAEKYMSVSAGQSSTYSVKDQIFSLHKLDANEIAWKTGLLIFQNTPLEEVAKRLEQVYEVKIKIDKPVRSCMINTTFNNLSIEDILIIIQKTLKIEYSINKNQIYIKGSEC